VFIEFTDKGNTFKTGNLYFDQTTAGIQFYVDSNEKFVNSNFARVFD